MLSLLNREEVLNKNLSIPLKRAYHYSSFVIHEGKLPPGIHSFTDLIYLLKDIAYSLHNILKEYKGRKYEGK